MVYTSCCPIRHIREMQLINDCVHVIPLNDTISLDIFLVYLERVTHHKASRLSRLHSQKIRYSEDLHGNIPCSCHSKPSVAWSRDPL